MENSIILEPIHNDYTEDIVNLILPIQQKEFNVDITIEDQQDLLDVELNYHQPGGGFWGAKKDGELIGTIALIAVGHHAGVIRKMFVKKDFRGKELGVAQLLLDNLVDYCRAKDIRDIYLGTVDVLKAAQRFYEKNGFDIIEQAALPVYFPRMALDNRFYHLKLN